MDSPVTSDSFERGAAFEDDPSGRAPFRPADPQTIADGKRVDFHLGSCAIVADPARVFGASCRQGLGLAALMFASRCAQFST